MCPSAENVAKRHGGLPHSFFIHNTDKHYRDIRWLHFLPSFHRVRKILINSASEGKKERVITLPFSKSDLSIL